MAKEYISKKWIQSAVHESKKGWTTNWCKSHGYKGVSSECLSALRAHAKKVGGAQGKTLMGRANFAARAQGGF